MDLVSLYKNKMLDKDFSIKADVSKCILLVQLISISIFIELYYFFTCTYLLHNNTIVSA